METTKTLEHGDYCEVTREQAVELLTIEGQIRDNESKDSYIADFFDVFDPILMGFQNHIGLILSGMKLYEHKKKLPFADFKQRLVNTVKV